jgi:hypothetical protein
LVVIASTLGRGTDSLAGAKRVKVLRRKEQLEVRPRAEEIAASQQAQRERKFKNREFKDIPLAVTKVSNLQSDTWYKDLEIEVKNISGKPIYFILAYLQFPDIPEPGDAVYGIALHYGERRNIDYRKDADPKDPHLNPGAKFTFTIPEKMKEGLRDQHETTPEQMKKLELQISVVSFGDGTGIVAERLSERKRSHSDLKKNNHSGRPGKSNSTEPPPQDGCGSCSRYIMDDQPYVACYYANGDECPSDHAITSPERPCTRVRAIPFPCGQGVRCHNDQIYQSEYCPGSSPTPTPTPSASPTPTPCPDGSFNQNPNGDCPSNSYQHNGCCICQERNTNCARFGQGQLNGSDYCTWVEESCDCYNVEGRCEDHPRPSPTPTPSPGSGGPGGGDPGGGDPGGGSCTEYWWVLYDCSTESGRILPQEYFITTAYASENSGSSATFDSCVEVGRWYAGCW